jgi:hypothetical protein
MLISAVSRFAGARLGFYAPVLVCDIPEDFGQAHREHVNSSTTRISALQRKI